MQPVIWMFSGQGSQYYDMGGDLYDSDPVFRGTMNCCDEILRPLIGASLVEIVYQQREDRFAPFDRVLFTNPAICCLQYSMAQVLLKRGLRPDFALGYSIGELSACAVAGVLSLEDCLRAVVRLAELLESDVPEGNMLAVLGSPRLVERAPASFQGASVAADNFPTHFVLSGDPSAISRARTELAASKTSVDVLPVRHAFHSPHMDGIEQAFKEYLGSLRLVRPAVRLISSTHGLIEQITPDSIWDTIRQPVEFRNTIEALERGRSYLYVDLGPSGTLGTFVKYNLVRDCDSVIAPTVTRFRRAAENVHGLEAMIADVG